MADFAAITLLRRSQLGRSDELRFLGFPRERKSDLRLIFGDQPWIAASFARINGNV